MLGPDGKPLERPRLVRHRGARGRGRRRLCRHRARQSDRALRHRQGRPARARPADRGAARHEAAAAQQEHRMPRGGAEGQRARRHADLDFRARPRQPRQPDGLPDRRPGGSAAGGVFSFKRTDDFDVSDCAATPDGRLLVLERRFSWARGLAIRIRSVPLAAIKPGALVDGPELIFADMGYQIDNMEGLSVHRDDVRRAGADADLRRQFLCRCSERCCCSSRWSGNSATDRTPESTGDSRS